MVYMPRLSALSFPPCLSLISPYFSATPYLPRSLWIDLCLLFSPPKCGRAERVGGQNLISLCLDVIKSHKVRMN